jgi:hypothetical protein
MDRRCGYLILALWLAACSARVSIATPTATRAMLEQDAQAWQASVEGSATYTLKGVAKPSLDGQALQCSITGGKPYSNVQCYRNLPWSAGADVVAFALSFQFSPQTTYNNQGGESVVQALEFSISQWCQGKRYRLAIQWENVGEAGEQAPQWRYWNPQSPSGRPWAPLGSSAVARLQAEQWHTLKLEGRLTGDQITYQSLSVDGQSFPLNLNAAPVPASGEPDRLAVSVQLDGNSQGSPYDVFIDQVSLMAHP